MQYCFFCHCISTQLHHYPSWKKSSYLITWNVERPVKTAGRHIYSLPINRCNFWMNLNICENTILTIQLAQPLWLFGIFLLDFLAESWSWCAFLFTQRVEMCRNQQSAVMHELFEVSKVTLCDAKHVAWGSLYQDVAKFRCFPFGSICVDISSEAKRYETPESLSLDGWLVRLASVSTWKWCLGRHGQMITSLQVSRWRLASSGWMTSRHKVV